MQTLLSMIISPQLFSVPESNAKDRWMLWNGATILLERERFCEKPDQRICGDQWAYQGA